MNTHISPAHTHGKAVVREGGALLVLLADAVLRCNHVLHIVDRLQNRRNKKKSDPRPQYAESYIPVIFYVSIFISFLHFLY